MAMKLSLLFLATLGADASSAPAPPTPPAAGAKNTWAVIAAGSAGFMNYRHQADACHAYHVLIKSGIPAEQIIVMMQDDVANSSENPFKGKLFNRPGNDVPDVYAGCKIDYRGKVVTAKLFLSVITGDETGVPTGGRVLKSTSSDRVFLNFVDHGGQNIVAFPNGPLLHSSELATALKTMQTKKLFSELLFYMEACESGSMFPSLPTDSKIFAVTASNAKESSWGFYCSPDDLVNGKHMGTCLGDLFSISWMEDSDLGAYQTETISTQVAHVTKRTNKSHVTTFGDKSFESEPFGNFEFRVGGNPSVGTSDAAAWDVRDIPLKTATYKYEHASTTAEKDAAFHALQKIIANREADQELFGSIAHRICKGGRGMKNDCVDELQRAKLDMKNSICHKEAVNVVHEVCPRRFDDNAGGWNAFNMKFSQLLVNACESSIDDAAIKKAVEQECKISAAVAASVLAAEDTVVV